MTDIDELKTKLRAAIAKASPGPWRKIEDNDDECIVDADDKVIHRDVYYEVSELSDDNSAYILTANPKAISIILDENDHLRDELKKLMHDIERYVAINADLLSENAGHRSSTKGNET